MGARIETIQIGTAVVPTPAAPSADARIAGAHRGGGDPRTTMRYDRGRQSLDRHAAYIVAAFIAGFPLKHLERSVPPNRGASNAGTIPAPD